MLTYDSYGETYKIRLKLTTYAENGNLAIIAECWDEEYKYWDRFSVFTVNLSEKLPEDCAYIDINNSPDLPDWIKEHGIGEPTGKVSQSGFCAYPLYKFDLQKIKGIIAEEDKET